MIMNSESLNWHQPTELGEAQALLSRFPDAMALAGGQHLISRWQKTRVPTTVVSLSQIAALRNIELNGTTLEIGAAVTLTELASSETVSKVIPSLSGLAGKMGDRFMRNRATLGGALCTTQLAGCIPAAMLGTNATVHTTSRAMPSSEWFQPGGAVPHLEKGELIVRVSLQVPAVATHQYLRLIPARFALVTLFASRSEHGFAVGISGAAATAFRSTVAEAWLEKGDASDVGGLLHLLSGHPVRTDHHASSAYREAQTRRLLKNAADVVMEPSVH